MSYQIEHQHNDNTFYIQVFGQFSADQYDRIMTEVTQSDDMNVDSHTIWDLTQMDFTQVHKDFLSNIIEHRKKFDEHRGENAKAAIVATTDLGFGVSRQYEALSYEFSQKMQIFRNVDDAKKWLNS
jgi:hypothetical protein